MTDQTVETPVVAPVSAVVPDVPAVPVPIQEQVPTEQPKPAEEKPKTTLYKVPNVFKSKLAHIDNVCAKEGFVTLQTKDGKIHRKTAEEVRNFARDCAQMLQSMYSAESRGVVVPAHVKSQTQELITKLSTAWRTAKHQQESALKMDHVPRAMQRITDNLAWQKGDLTKERGAYTADGLPEEVNIKYFLQRFPMLTEGEIATILRATDVPYNLRIQILAGMNGKRMMEANKLDAKDVMRIAGRVEIPTGVGLNSSAVLRPDKPIRIVRS